MANRNYAPHQTSWFTLGTFLRCGMTLRTQPNKNMIVCIVYYMISKSCYIMVLLSCMMCFYFFDILMTQSNTIYNLLYKNRLYNLYCIYIIIYIVLVIVISWLPCTEHSIAVGNSRIYLVYKHCDFRSKVLVYQRLITIGYNHQKSIIIKLNQIITYIIIICIHHNIHTHIYIYIIIYNIYIYIYILYG